MSKHLDRANLFVTVLLGISALYDSHVTRKRNKHLDEKDTRIKDLEDEVKKLKEFQAAAEKPAVSVDVEKEKK